jgi:hypothetical protein
MKRESGRRVFVSIFLISATLLLLYSANSINDGDREKEFVFLSNLPLKNILSDEATLNVSAKHQVFLIETHMDKERELTNARQACTVESAGI